MIEDVLSEYARRLGDGGNVEVEASKEAISAARRRLTEWEQQNPGVLEPPIIEHSERTAWQLAHLGLSAEAIVLALLHHLTPEQTQEVLSEGEPHRRSKLEPLLKDLHDVLCEWNRHAENSDPNLRVDDHELSGHRLNSVFHSLTEHPEVLLVLLYSSLDAIQFSSDESGLVGRELPLGADRLRFAQQVQLYFAPFPHFFHLDELLWQLEDTVFALLEPHKYGTVQDAVKSNRQERQRIVDALQAELQTHLDRQLGGGVATVTGRSKGIFSLFKKLVRDEPENVFQLSDIIALRVVFNPVRVDAPPRLTSPQARDSHRCQVVMNACLAEFQPAVGLFNDYVNSCTPENYQALHVGVLYPQRERPGSEFEKAIRSFEIQVRTEQMHQVAEFGEAAHWRYKLQEVLRGDEGAPGESKDAPLMHWYELCADWFNRTATVRASDGSLHLLPGDSTLADAAYRLLKHGKHPRAVEIELPGSDGGSARTVNNLTQRVPNMTRIERIPVFGKHPDIVESWLRRARTPVARQRMADALERSWGDSAAKRLSSMGARILADIQDEHRLRSFVLPAQAEKVLECLEQKGHAFQNLDSLFTSIARGQTNPETIAGRLKGNFMEFGHELYRDLCRKRVHALQKRKDLARDLKVAQTSDLLDTAYVGLDYGEAAGRCVVAGCCKPLPGDLVVLSTHWRPRGLEVERVSVVHHNECPRIAGRFDQFDVQERLWTACPGELTFSSDVDFHILDEPGALLAIASLIDVNIRRAASVRLSPANVVIQMELEVPTVAALAKCVDNILEADIPYLLLAERFPIRLRPTGRPTRSASRH